MLVHRLLHSALPLSILGLATLGIAQEKGKPPMVVPPPKVGDPIGKQPPTVDPEIVVPPPKVAPRPKVAPPPAAKPLGERIFCSSISLEDAMRQCEEWTRRERGECQNIGPSQTCKYQVKVVAIMDEASLPSPR